MSLFRQCGSGILVYWVEAAGEGRLCYMHNQRLHHHYLAHNDFFRKKLTHCGGDTQLLQMPSRHLMLYQVRRWYARSSAQSTLSLRSRWIHTLRDIFQLVPQVSDSAGSFLPCYLIG